MKAGKVRPIAICVFQHQGRILVSEGYDSIKAQFFYRPLGGKIEFGERGEQTVVREIREELGFEALEIRYLGLLENIFTYEGQKGHEIVLVYDGKFADPQIYGLVEISGMEDEDSPIKAVWKPLAAFDGSPEASSYPLYPEGLLELLRGK